MQPRILLDISLSFETALKFDPNKPEILDEEVKQLVDLLNDLRSLLSRYSA